MEDVMTKLSAEEVLALKKRFLDELAAEKKAEKNTPLPDGWQELAKEDWLKSRIRHELSDKKWCKDCACYAKGSTRAKYIDAYNKAVDKVEKYTLELAAEIGREKCDDFMAELEYEEV